MSGRLAPGTAEVLGGFADGRWLLDGVGAVRLRLPSTAGPAPR